MNRIVLARTLLVLLPAVTVRAQNSLPDDIYPDSRSRLPLNKPGDSDEAVRQVASTTVTNFVGVQNMRTTLDRYGYRGDVAQSASPLGPAFMQFVILVTAREDDQPYEWSLHEMQAVAVGLDPAEIDVVRNRKPLAGLPENEAVVVKMAHEIFAGHQLSSATYAEGLKTFGQKNLVDIIGLIADYLSVSVGLSAFNQQMPPVGSNFCLYPSRRPRADLSFHKLFGKGTEQ